METDNNNPVIKTEVKVLSHRKVGAHDPFSSTTEEEVLHAVLSFNGIWPCELKKTRDYTYEVERTVALEIYKRDYDYLLSEQAVLGWSQYSVSIGTVLSVQHSPTTETAERK
jgi:hypothetical protein